VVVLAGVPDSFLDIKTIEVPHDPPSNHREYEFTPMPPEALAYAICTSGTEGAPTLPSSAHKPRQVLSRCDLLFSVFRKQHL
jgi:non-ribosomal peptide synthetase component F